MRIRKVNKLRILFFIILFIMFKPAYLARLSAANMIFSVGKIVLFFIGLYYVSKRKAISKIGIAIFFYCICLNLSTIINQGNLTESIGFFISSMTVVFISEMMCDISIDDFLKASLLLFEFMIYANFISVLLAPHGLYRIIQPSGWWTDACWFLGLRNGMTPLYVIGAFLELTNVYAENSSLARKRCFIYVFISSLTIILINSNMLFISNTKTAGGLSLIWFSVLCYFPASFFFSKMKVVDYKMSVLANYVFAFLLTIFGVQKYFSFIIAQVLRKDVTMLSRVVLWKRAFDLILERPVFGYGCEDGIVMARRLKDIAAVSTTQNGWTDVLYKGGLVLFIVFSLYFVTTIVFVSKKRLSDKKSFCIGYITLVYLMAGQSEALVGARFFYFIMLICAFSAKFDLNAVRDDNIEPAFNKNI